MRYVPQQQANSSELLALWRRERSYRVGHAIALGGSVLAALALLADIVYSQGWVILTDALLVSACLLSWKWVSDKPHKHYFWRPVYHAFWIACLPTYWTTGGIDSPFFGLGLALLYILGEVLDSEGRSWVHLGFPLLHVPVFLLIEAVHPLTPKDALQTNFSAIITVVNLFAVFVCVRAMLQTEESLSKEFTEREGLLRDAQSIAKVGSWEWDVENDRITWSDELFRIFDVKREDFDPSYKAYLARLHPQRREHIEQLIAHSAKTGEDFTFENEIQTSQGIRYVFSRGRVIKDETGKTIKMLGTSQDMTERKFIEAELVSARTELELRVEERTEQLEDSLKREKAAKEQAENASQAKMQFLANMSHEIRTPMNSILGFTELLESENSPEKNAEYMKRIRTNGNLLMTLIDDILDLSKFEAGQIPIQKSTVALRRMIDDSVNSFLPALIDKDLKLELNYFGELPNLVKTDGKRVSQILVNLVGNAVKFSLGGTIRVSVSTIENGSRLSICVEDSGMGISPENQKNLFQPFSQGDSSVARKFGGSGLGLALSRRISEALGGKLELQRSEVGRGSLFELVIPLEAPDSGGQIASSEPVQTTTNSQRERRLLLAEDSPDNAFLISHFIKPLGYQIDIVGDGIRAVEAVQKTAYDLILMDIQMPGMDGLEATRRIRAGGFKKPIIALTAHALPAEAQRSLNAGCDRHLTKPISRTDLANVLESFA